MTSECYPCTRGVGIRPAGSATGNPLGVCRICHVLACDGHCQRNASYPRVECVICIPSLVAASTAGSSTDIGRLVAEASTAGSSTDIGRLVADLMALLARLGGDGALIRSVEEFVARYPDLDPLVAEADDLFTRDVVPNRKMPGGRYYESLDREGRRLIVLAIVILRRLEINPNLLPGPVRILYESWQ